MTTDETTKRNFRVNWGMGYLSCTYYHNGNHFTGGNKTSICGDGHTEITPDLAREISHDLDAAAAYFRRVANAE